jgi:DNA topoisomerase-2
MHLFDEIEKLKKYDTVQEIIDDYYDVRLDMYETRKNHLIDSLEDALVLLSNKAKYIQETISGVVDLRKKKKEQVIELLESRGYDVIDDDHDFKYLVKMPMDSVTEENVAKLMKEHADTQADLDKIKNTTPQQMWISELDILSQEYTKYKEDRERLTIGNKKIVKTKTSTKKKALLVEA